MLVLHLRYPNLDLYMLYHWYWALFLYEYSKSCSYITHTHTHIYILWSTDSFVVSQLFSVARPTWCFKLGLKPAWFYVNWTSHPWAIIILEVSEGIFLSISFYIYIIGYLECSILEMSYCILYILGHWYNGLSVYQWSRNARAQT